MFLYGDGGGPACYYCSIETHAMHVKDAKAWMSALTGIKRSFRAKGLDPKGKAVNHVEAAQKPYGMQAKSWEGDIRQTTKKPGAQPHWMQRLSRIGEGESHGQPRRAIRSIKESQPKYQENSLEYPGHGPQESTLPLQGLVHSRRSENTKQTQLTA